jgi:uncharacterized phage protein (TIGR02216 family)
VADTFPWKGVMHAGLCLLRLSPKAFWALTPIEFHAMTGGLAKRSNGPGRAELEGMMARFPDVAPPLPV